MTSKEAKDQIDMIKDRIEATEDEAKVKDLALRLEKAWIQYGRALEKEADPEAGGSFDSEWKQDIEEMLVDEEDFRATIGAPENLLDMPLYAELTSILEGHARTVRRRTQPEMSFREPKPGEIATPEQEKIIDRKLHEAALREREILKDRVLTCLREHGREELKTELFPNLFKEKIA